ncbi:MAG: hypothetical protein AB4372_18800 [Xenococcus sp. (in: cyanobacteria)]
MSQNGNLVEIAISKRSASRAAQRLLRRPRSASLREIADNNQVLAVVENANVADLGISDFVVV